MTDKTLVFCKECDYFEEGASFDVFGCLPDKCKHEPTQKVDSVSGYYNVYTTCESKNKRCDCAFFKPRCSFLERLFRQIN